MDINEGQINRDEYIQFRTEVTLFVHEARQVFTELANVLRERAAEAVVLKQIRDDVDAHELRLDKAEGRLSMILFGGAAIVAAFEFGLRVLPFFGGS